MPYRDSEHERLEAEVARLRAALAAIAGLCCPGQGGHKCGALVKILERARSALADGVE